MGKVRSIAAAVLLPAVLPALIAAIGAPALAQETDAPAPAADAGAVISYTPADFAAARPNTALEMLGRLPGFSVDGGEQVRGFAGAAGNVLIDGRRPTIKSDSLFETLERIPIDQVERIDLIRGGAPGIDMQGRTLVANVIRKRIDTFQQVGTVGAFVFTETGHFLPYATYEATRRSGEHQFDLQLDRGIGFDDSVGAAQRTAVDVATGDVLVEDAFTEGDGSNHTARANYKGPLAGGVFSFNSLAGIDDWKSESDFFTDTTYERFVNSNSGERGELGVNYTRSLTPRFELEALGLYRINAGSSVSTGLTLFSSSLFESEFEAGESIGRSVLRFTRSPELSFEGGGEIAFNYREQQIALTVDGTPITLPASDVRIEELRGEIFAQGTWRPGPRSSVEAGVRAEESTITQSGQIALERSFFYPKPRMLFTWSPDERGQVRLRVEREIGQLNFGDFISNVNLNTRYLNAGNAELEPDKTWVYEVALERRFWGAGAAVLTLRHEDIQDVVDVFPFLVLVDDDNDGIPDDSDNNGEADVRLVTGPGNIGDGTNDFAQLDLTLPLANLGIDGGELKVGAWLQNGEVVDPLTGETRRISGQRPERITVNYRHDLPELKLTLGAFWFAGWEERYYRLDEVQHNDLRNYFELFAEYKPSQRLTLRAGLNNAIPYSFTMERRVFDAPRDVGAVELIETEQRFSQVIATARARLTF